MLPELVADEIFGLLLVFVRVGAAMLLPGFGEPYVLARWRLLLAFWLALALAGPLASDLPALPAEPAAFVRLIGGETLLGLFIGASGRAMFAALHVAGTAIAFQSGLAAAAVFDPNEATQGTLPGTFLTTTALVLLFVDARHLLLQALAASYAGLPVGSAPPVGDMADLLARLVNEAFTVGIRVAAPLLAVSLLMYLLMGILNRLMPQFQVFFIALPLQILIAFATLILSLAGALVFFGFFEDGLASLTLGGRAPMAEDQDQSQKTKSRHRNGSTRRARKVRSPPRARSTICSCSAPGRCSSPSWRRASQSPSVRPCDRSSARRTRCPRVRPGC